MFKFLKYPYEIRKDAIIAVGAPSSVGFLVKAIYWLYLLAKTQRRPDVDNFSFAENSAI